MRPDEKNPEKSLLRRTLVCPRWLPGSDYAFWYTAEVNDNNFQFILVNCETGLCRPAFDHEGLARDLSKLTGELIEPTELPFWWINLDEDAAWVRFQHKDKTWQYSQDHGLEEWTDHFDHGNFDLGCEETASPWSRRQSITTLTNHTADKVEFAWIGNDGVPQPYGSIQPGESRTIDSWIGHKWRLRDSVSGKKVICELKHSRGVAMVEEIPTGLVLNWDGDDEVEEVVEPGDTYRPGAYSKLFIEDFNVWAQTLDGSKTRITVDGEKDNGFKDVWLSPDGNRAVAFQCKPPADSPAYFVNSCPSNNFHPKLIKEQYPRPGDRVEYQKLRLFNFSAEENEVPVDDGLFQNACALTHVGWSDDSQKYRFIFNERGHQRLRLLQVRLDMSVSTIVEEQSDTFIDYNQKLYYKLLHSTKEVIWASERDGWNHLYLFNLDNGNLINQVTKGSWVVRSVEHVDVVNRRIWFTGLDMISEQDPYYTHLASIDFDGSDLRIVTKGDGTHTWKWGPNKRFIIDSWSRVDCPPQTSVREAQSGREIVALQSQTIDSELGKDWESQKPERFEAVGRDGTTNIYGIIIRPRDFDDSQKYPIVEYIYAGPQRFNAPKTFQDLSSFRRIADQGFIVVCADGMGTNWRSKAFHDVCYKNLKDAGFPDRIAWIRAAAEVRPWMDLSRVGCYGSSSGGQNAAAAVIHHSDFYKAAVAVSGTHDNRLGQLLWNEMFMGYPIDSSYEQSSNVTHAHKLDGALMLVAGELDNNVDPVATMRLADALIKADKDFDMVIVPCGSHYVDATLFVQKKRDAFFKRHLKDQ
ncbi:peptidase S9 [Sarocladium strictum]